jgi:hypothetical protein
MHRNRIPEIVGSSEQDGVPEAVKLLVVGFPFSLQPAVEKETDGLILPDFGVKCIHQFVYVFQVCYVLLHVFHYWCLKNRKNKAQLHGWQQWLNGRFSVNTLF